jgi:hypothetical protein
MSINDIPDVVVADIKRFINDKTYHHLFYHIHQGKVIQPSQMYEWGDKKTIVYLYEGYCGLGHYINIVYSLSEQIFIFQSITHPNEPVAEFKSKNWTEVHEHVSKFCFNP